jgi:hypothetical protein
VAHCKTFAPGAKARISRGSIGTAEAVPSPSSAFTKQVLARSITSNRNSNLKGGGQECPPYTARFIAFYLFCGLGDVKGCKVPLLFAFPPRHWRERGLSDKLLGGEIDGDVRIVWFTSAGQRTLLLVLWCGDGV